MCFTEKNNGRSKQAFKHTCKCYQCFSNEASEYKNTKVTSNVAITKKNEKNNTPDYSCKYIAYTCFIPSNFLIKSKYLIGCLI